MKIAAAQISCSLGDLKANLLKVRDFSTQAKEASADLIVFSDLAYATTFDFQSYTERSQWKTTSTLLSFLLPGRFRALNIFGLWRWRERSRIKVTSLWRTASTRTMACPFAAHQGLSILTASSLHPLAKIVKNS